ncbi:hypothetical protein [Hyphomonas oceanitis]|uniref:hypothetical protein n=1 Tax=Hyphomonas oceanitis TaxID=81033 RepID=UPI003001C5BB
MTVPPMVSSRNCEGCTMCCKLLSITELSKPRQHWCDNCEIGKGCKIYPERPKECVDFYCTYLLDIRIGEEWKPSQCRMVLTFEDHANRIVIHVDRGRANAWTKEPYYSQIKNWAVRAAAVRGQVVVWQGLDAIIVLPNTDKNLGRVRDDQLIITSEKRTPQGVVLDAVLMDRDDPRLSGLELPNHDDPRTVSTNRGETD